MAPAYPARRFQLPASAAHMKMTVATRIGYGPTPIGRSRRMPSARSTIHRVTLLESALPHDARGHEAENQVEQRERYQQRQAGFEIGFRERLGDAEGEPTPQHPAGVA